MYMSQYCVGDQAKSPEKTVTIAWDLSDSPPLCCMLINEGKSSKGEYVW